MSTVRAKVSSSRDVVRGSAAVSRPTLRRHRRRRVRQQRSCLRHGGEPATPCVVLVEDLGADRYRRRPGCSFRDHAGLPVGAGSRSRAPTSSSCSGTSRPARRAGLPLLDCHVWRGGRMWSLRELRRGTSRCPTLTLIQLDRDRIAVLEVAEASERELLGGLSAMLQRSVAQSRPPSRTCSMAAMAVEVRLPTLLRAARPTARRRSRPTGRRWARCSPTSPTRYPGLAGPAGRRRRAACTSSSTCTATTTTSGTSTSSTPRSTDGDVISILPAVAGG